MTDTAKTRIPNYKKSIIYKLCCKDPTITECYIGSTTNFDKRKQGHKNTCNNEGGRDYNLYVYQFIRNNGGFENWCMIQIEKYKASDKRDLESRERHWIETLKSKLNITVPTRTDKEYNKMYRETHKEEEHKRNEEYRLNHRNGQQIMCDICGYTISKANKSSHIKTKKHQANLANTLNKPVIASDTESITTN